MRDEFEEGWVSARCDPLDAHSQDFDWELLSHRLGEDAGSGDNDPTLAQTVVRLLQLLLPPVTTKHPRRIQPLSTGLRLIALAWVLNPGYFVGSPSLSELARRCSVRLAALANHTGYFSRLLGWRNRGQRHASNWLRRGKPTHRGEDALPELRRNVPPLVETRASRRKRKRRNRRRRRRPTG